MANHLETPQANRALLILLACSFALFLNGCASTSSPSAVSNSNRPVATEFQWPQQQSLLWTLGQKLTPTQLGSSQLSIGVGPAADLEPWPATLASQQRQRELEQALRQLGFRGQLQSRYQPDLNPDQIRIEVSRGY